MTPLAIDGGTPLRSAPFPVWPQVSEPEIAAAEAVLRSGRLNYWTGEEGRSFEAEYAERLGRSHAVALANGTLALELALRAFGIGAGDEVVVPARTFVATASACVAVGATPVIADIDPDTSCVTPETIAAAVTPRTRAVIPVHVAGWPADMPAIMATAEQHRLLVIEDCAQAHGARVAGREVGSFGHAAAFSFCNDKIITTGGEGGMLLLDDGDAYERAWSYKDHGKSRARVADAPLLRGPAFCWLHDSFGTNWRMTEMQAAMGRVALARLDERVAARQHNASRLAAALADCKTVRIPWPEEGSEGAFYRLMGRIGTGSLAEGWTHERFIAAVAAEGVPCLFGTCAEIYLERAFAVAGAGPAERLPGAQASSETSVAFLVHPTMTDADVDDVAAAVLKVAAVAAP